MQFDMFGDGSAPTVLESSPPVLLPSGSWIPPETVAFNAALRNGALDEAIAILKPLAVPVLSSVLLASGFSVPHSQNRRALMFLLGPDIVAAAKERMTGREFTDARRTGKINQVEPGEVVAFNPGDYAVSFLPLAKVGDFITHDDGFNYVIDTLVDENHIHAIRPMEVDAADVLPGHWPINPLRTVTLTTNKAKLAKQRYIVEEENALKTNSAALATASGYSNLIRANSELSEGKFVRFNDSIYRVDALRGTPPYSEVLISRVVELEAGRSDVERLSLSHGEARAAQRALFPGVASFNVELAQAQLLGVTRGERVNTELAGNMKPGALVVDGGGKQYAAFSARFGYLEVHPIGENGKPEIFAGNSIFFHVDPATAPAYPERRHDPVFLVNELVLDSSNELMHNANIDDAVIAAEKKEVENDAEIDGSEDLRARAGTEDRGDGVGGYFSGESLDAGVAQSGRGAAEAGDVSVLPGNAGERGEGRFGGRSESEPFVAAGNLADARDQRSAAIGGVNGVLNTSSTQAQRLTREELNSLLVTDMSDEQLLQAKEVFAGSRRSESIERQIQKRGLTQAAAAAALASLAVDANKKTVRLPAAISEAISADMNAQKARYMRLQSVAKRSGNTLEQRLALQDKAKSASDALRKMRQSVFDVEDSAALAIEAGQLHVFAQHAILFPKAFASVSSLVTSLDAGVAPVGNAAGWDSLPIAAKTEVLKRSGWVTQTDELNFMGVRLLNEAWAEIPDGTKATIAKNMPAGAALEASSTLGGEAGANGPSVAVDSVATASLVSAGQSAVSREFRDPDKLNALVNPILDGDWFKLGNEEWQARNGYSGRGWSLVKDRALHPQVRNFDSQVDFMRSVIEVTQFSRESVTTAALPDMPELTQAAGASVAPSQEVSLDRNADMQLVAAGRLLSQLTRGRGDIYALSGRDSVQLRVQLMATLLGREKVTQAEAGVTAIREEFYKRAGIDTNTTSSGAEIQFQDWVAGLETLETDSLAAGVGASATVANTVDLQTPTASVVPLDDVWKGLSVEDKTEILKRSGFVNGQGSLSFVGTRLLGESWARVKVHSKVVDGLTAHLAGQSEAVTLLDGGLKSVEAQGTVAAAEVTALASVGNGAAGFSWVPGFVRNQVEWALERMKDVRVALEGVERARGDGATLAIEWADQAPKLVRPREILNKFKESALKNGVDAEGFLRSLGGVPDFARFDARTQAPVVVPATVERSEYPFGRTDVEDRFHGSRVRVLPELRGDVAWDGVVHSVFNGGRLVSVKRDSGEGERDYLPVRIGGQRLEVLEIKDSQPAVDAQALASVDAEKDPHIGRTWNTTRGKATITSLPFPKREESSLEAMYEFTTEDGATFRVYEDKIEEQIKRDEYQASPQGRADSVARSLAAEKAQAQRETVSAQIAAEKAIDDDKLRAFFSSVDYSALKTGQAKKALLAPVRFEGEIVKSYQFAEKLADRGLPMEITMEDRIKPMSRMASHRATQREQDAHAERVKNAGKKQVHYIGGFAVGAFEFAYAGFVKSRLGLENSAQVAGGTELLGSVLEEVPATSLGGEWSAQTHVLIAADSLAKLRSVDVHRLFEELPQDVDRFDSLRSYIVENRPDLLSAVVDAIDEVGMPARAAVNGVSDEQKAEIVAAQHAKAASIQAFLAAGNSVSLATQAQVLVLNSPDQIKLTSGGVSVAEGRDKNASDGVRWVFLFENQVAQLAAQVGVLDVVGAGRWLDKSGLDAAAVLGAAQSLAAQGAGDPALPDSGPQEVQADYSITDDDRIGQGGLAEKYRDNVRAIQIVRTLDAEKRHAVGEEKKALARYVGWGGLKGVFNPDNKQWGRQYFELRGLLSDAEWDAASRSQLDAHYTAPIVVNSMYSALSRLGFHQGRMLEPSVGVGNFIGMMPESMRSNSDLHGVELDILTSQIVAALYPSAKISKATGFQNYNVPAGYFDVVIGNPPFGSQQLTDDKGSVFSGWSIHNYFFAKSIQMLRPGGIMPMVVSHNFLDKLDPHVRQWISRRAELVSGVRLPNTAFKENANTEVVTDILIFKRLDYEHSLGKQEAPDWLDTTDVALENKKTGAVEKIAVNNYFLNNPQNVLGENSATGSMYRENEYTVLPNGDLKTQLAQWVDSLPRDIYVPFERSATDLEMAAVEVPEFVKEGSFYLKGTEVWQRLPDVSGSQRAVQWQAPNQRALERMTGMIEIRDVLRSQMKMERSARGVSEQMIDEGRKNLNRLYDKFQKANGFLNDPINRRIFIDDTESALIQALEFDYEKAITAAKAEEFGIEPRPASATKADIFKNRVLFPPGEIEVVETAKDALLHSLNYTGGVDMEYMQNAYGKDSAQIIEELGDLLFHDPVNGLVTSDHYLSGDVKTKLAEVTKAAESDVSLTRNVEALKKIIPVDKMPSEIHAALGAAWIPESVFNEFSREISGGDVSFNYVAATGQWLGHEVNSPDQVKNTVDFGTQMISSLKILNLLMNSRAPEIKHKVDGKYVTDQPATEAARQKADKIKAHWDSWVWSDFERAEKLASIYNDKFNRTVERKYDGSHLTFPGMSPMIKLLSHQKNGVWRGLQDRTILLDQVVGAGKTYEGIAMLMEMRRLGISKKPLIAVPNHLTLQWRSDFYKLYPGANVLAATPQDFEKDNRERFFSKITTGNWDAVIVGHSSLTKIPVPLAAERKIIKEQFDDISDAIEDMKRSRGDRNAIRDMEVIKENFRAKIEKLKEKGGKKDNVVNFEDLGVDTLFVDEMHEFKNLFFTTQMNRVSGLGNPAGSGKAFDMFVKIRWLRDTYGQDAPLITATGTPVSNSLAEMFTMQRYMQYDKLKENNIHVFDAWAKQYGDVQTVYEVAPSGNGYRLSQRFAKFKNLGSLMGQYRSFADVVTLDDLKAQEIAMGKTFPVPNMVGDKPLNVVAKRSELQEKFFGVPEIRRNDDGEIVFQIDLTKPVRIVALGNGKFAMARSYINKDSIEDFQQFGKDYETAEEAAYALALGAVTPEMDLDKDSIVGQFENLPQLVKETKGKINALSLTSLANKAGLDYRLIDAGAADFPDSKINQAIDNIVNIGKQWEADRGTQLIFCDLSVPLSAKAKMASKEKRVYVRNEDGGLMHKMATMHTLKDNEGIAYFVTPEGKGKSRTFNIYSSFTGQLMKEGLDSKLDAHEFVKTLGKEEGGLVRWLSMQEESRVIGADEIDEYKNENDIDSDEGSIDQEITLHDIEGATGIAAFSVYDDMKAKLIAKGVPPAQIEFIHDHDTPQAKALLFKRVNDGDVRYLFGSTPKMGAGTNVQKRLVGLHHIDAPWRPSDLEQREGRIIRRGNSLYERDPEGFKIVVNRYATSQTYDTRRWQLLEHKASGVEQLRKYTGANEIDDVATEAANSADMKAAASGNPLILKETQLATELKKLVLLERAHRDGEYILNSRVRSERFYAEDTGPKGLQKWKFAKSKLTEDGVLAVYDNKPLHTRDELIVAMNAVAKSLQAADAVKTVTYRGVDFGFQQDHMNNHTRFITPVGDTFLIDMFSPAGSVARMNNWCESIDKTIDVIEKRIAHSVATADELQKSLGKPFEQAGLLAATVEEHGKVQRALMKSNAVAAVKPAEVDEFKAAVDAQKAKLRAYGLASAVDELENVDAFDVVAKPGVLVSLDGGGVQGGLGDGGAVAPGGVDAQEALLDRVHGDSVSAQAALSSVAEVDSGSSAPAQVSAVSGLGQVKARMVDVLSVDVPNGWIVMNAPRPILGQKTMEGDFVSGRHYAALDPADSMTDVYIKENVKLDARVLVVVPREMQMDVALHGNKYRDNYLQVAPGERYEMLSPTLEKLRDLPYDELSKVICEAKSVVADGLHSGMILSVVAGVVSQKVDRAGTPVHHAASKLSLPVKEGDVVDISYSGGVGVVSGLDKGVNFER